MKLSFSFVPFPLEIWEKPMNLSRSEFRLLGWLLAGLRFGKEQDTYTDSEILNGKPGRLGVGLTRNSLKEARTGLVSNGFIVIKQLSEGTFNYRLNLENPSYQKLPPSVKTSHPKCQTLTPNVSKVDTYKELRNIENTERADNPPAKVACKAHPDSGLTNWGTCWQCYSDKVLGL
jgi:hypothetical protein